MCEKVSMLLVKTFIYMRQNIVQLFSSEQMSQIRGKLKDTQSSNPKPEASWLKDARMKIKRILFHKNISYVEWWKIGAVPCAFLQLFFNRPAT